MNFTFSENLPKFLASPSIEGVVLHPYKDSVGIPTIGIGTTVYPNGTKVTMTDANITVQQAYDFCLDHLNHNVLPTLNRVVTVDQNQNQVDAIGSLVYNIGVGGFVDSTVLRKINESAPIEEIETSWKMWNKAGGHVVQGLVNRRNKELELYNTSNNEV